MVANSAEDATDNAEASKTCEPGYCLKYTRTWLEIGSYYYDAISAWNAAKVKHKGDRNPPEAAPLFYKGGSHGHIVLSLPSDMRSTDCTTGGKVGTEDVGWPERAWGYDYLGWTEDLNTVRIPWLEPEDAMPKDHYLVTSDAVPTDVREGETANVQWRGEGSDDEGWHTDGWASIEPRTAQIATVAGWVTLDAPGRVYLTVYQEDGDTASGHVAIADGGPGAVNIAAVTLVQAHYQLRMRVGAPHGPVSFEGGKLRWHSFDHD